MRPVLGDRVSGLAGPVAEGIQRVLCLGDDAGDTGSGEGAHLIIREPVGRVVFVTFGVASVVLVLLIQFVAFVVVGVAEAGDERSVVRMLQGGNPVVGVVAVCRHRAVAVRAVDKAIGCIVGVLD